MEKLKIKEAIVVEGKYDKITLSQIVDGIIVETNGFSIFKDSEKRRYLAKLALERGLVILTDSDSAGFVIRNHLKSFIDEKYLKNAFIPPLEGKEKRKPSSSKEGLLGVEGIPKDILLNLLKKVCSEEFDSDNTCDLKITAADLYELGLLGRESSKQKREEFFTRFDLPVFLNTNELLKYINTRKEAREWLYKNLEKCI